MHQTFSNRSVSALASLCSGWRGATGPDNVATCNLVKKERKQSEEDEDEILCKLQRDDVSTSGVYMRMCGL